MESIEYRVKYRSRKDEFRLWPLGDIHAGSLHCAENEIKRQVQIIKDDPHSVWVGMGDYAELITPKDSRWDTDVIAEWVERSNPAESQRVWVRNLFKPIADKCIGLLSGNHEESIRLHNYQDIHLDLCRDLGVTNLGYSCFVRFKFQRYTGTVHSFVGVFQHGSGGAQTEGGKIMRLKRLMDSFDADIYAMGHIHDIQIDTIPQITIDDAGKIKQKVRVGAITGSWMKSYTQGIRASYAERKGYPPSVLGCSHFVISPDKETLRVVG